MSKPDCTCTHSRFAHLAQDYLSRRQSKNSEWRSTANCQSCDCKKYKPLETAPKLLDSVLRGLLAQSHPLERQPITCSTCGAIRTTAWEVCPKCGELE